MAFVAILGEELVAVARYEEVTGTDRPEVAFFVDDRHHGRGIGTLLFEYLAAAARSRGLAGFTATVLPENYRMLGLFKRAGFDVKTSFDGGVIGVDIDLSITNETVDAIARRHSRARSRSVARLLNPSSVAVVGAGRTSGSVGHELLRQIVAGGFTGDIFPVNHAAEEVLGRRCWTSLTSIGAPIDLAVVAVPAASVERVVIDAVDADVGGLLVVSSGFSEAGVDGADRERRVVSMARSNGMRLIGPNSFGLVNTAPETRLRALFLPVGPEEGPVALLSQSGPLGAGVLEHMRAARVGMSSFVAVGNRADVSVNDVLDYWLDDDATAVALLYVENFGNLRNFARTARAVAARKPVVTVRPPDEHLVELLAQSGVVLVDSVAEMADVARVAAGQPVPAGQRVVVVSNTASVARLAASACRRYGLEVVVPGGIDASPPARVRADQVVLVGDVDTISADDRQPPDYERVLATAAVSADVDAVLVALVPTFDLTIGELSSLLGRIDRSIDKPLVATGLVGEDRLSVPGLPVFEFPEEAARALGALAAYGGWRQANSGDRQPMGEDQVEELATMVRPALVAHLHDRGNDADTTITLLSEAAPSMVDALDIPVADWRVVERTADLPTAAAALGYPVVLKGGGIAGRTVGEAGGAAIDLHDETELLGAFDRMVVARGATMVPAILQRMIASTGNARIELVQDVDLGAFVRLGIGGAVGTSVAPAARRFLPLIEGEEHALASKLATAVPLDGDARAVVARIIARLAAVAAAVPELARVVLDPVLIGGTATAVGDLTVTLRQWRHDPLGEVRRL